MTPRQLSKRCPGDEDTRYRGAGFIGSHVAEQLLEHGREVAVVDDLSTGKRGNVPERVRFYEADVRTECADVFEKFRPDSGLRRCCPAQYSVHIQAVNEPRGGTLCTHHAMWFNYSETRCEAVSHQAAQMDIRRSVREPDFDAEVNVIGTIRLLENCVEYDVGRFVFASTGGAVYGEQREFPAKEDHPQYPLSPYGVSKLAGERYLHFYHAQYGLPYVVLRYSNVYGPRQDPHGEAGVVAIFCENLAVGKASTINGTGEQTRDYVYVEDVARANVLALENNLVSGVYNIGTSLETSVNELYKLLREASGKDLPLKYSPAKPGEQLRSCVDPGKALRGLGWHPKVDLAEGLRKTLRLFGALSSESR